MFHDVLVPFAERQIITMAMIRRYCKDLDVTTEKEEVVKREVEGWVIHSLSNFCDFEERQIDSLTSIKSLRMNSLAYINFIVQVEDELCVEIDDKYLASDSFSTVGDMVKYFIQLCEIKEKQK